MRAKVCVLINSCSPTTANNAVAGEADAPPAKGEKGDCCSHGIKCSRSFASTPKWEGIWSKSSPRIGRSRHGNEIYWELTSLHTDRHADRNTAHPYWGRVE